MGVLESVVVAVLILPVSLLIILLYVLSTIGKGLGFRRKYVKFLLYIFEYGRKKIERANRLKTKFVEEEETDDGISTASESDYQDCCQHLPTNERLLNFKSGPVIANIGQGDFEHDEHINEKEPEFEFSDILPFVKSGIDAIVADQVTQRFASEELKSWNMLTRTNRRYEFISWKLSCVWVIGFFIRYFILLPLRVSLCFFGVVFLTMATALVGCIPSQYFDFKRKMYKIVYLRAFEVLSWSLSALITYHDLENRPGGKNSEDGKEGGGICVANHTSPIDVLVLAVDHCYDMVGQSHGGFLGVLQAALARASSHIWFERSEMKDREVVARRLREHVEDTKKLPILIFPEGTCINNSAVMQFKKGSFEIGGVIYPVAIKYDARFGDPFWDSSNYSMVQYLLMMMSSWAIVCDVWYLPPMSRLKGETSVDFANRVKSAIARKGGLVDLDWDGQLKRAPAKKEWKALQQLEYSKKLIGTPRTIRRNLEIGDSNKATESDDDSVHYS